jgi:hypothetical protein
MLANIFLIVVLLLIIFGVPRIIKAHDVIANAPFDPGPLASDAENDGTASRYSSPGSKGTGA